MCEDIQNERNISWTKPERLVFSYYTVKARLVTETAQFEIS